MALPKSGPNKSRDRPKASLLWAVFVIYPVALLNLFLFPQPSADLELPTDQKQRGNDSDRWKLKIAILSGFVSRDSEVKVKRAQNTPRINEGLMDHMTNKACYAHLWGYDYIFNTTVSAF